MKKISLAPPVGFGGEPITVNGEPLTMKDIFCGCLARFEVVAADSFGVFALGVKIHGWSVVEPDEQPADLTLEDAELELLKAALNQNKPGYVALVLGQAYKAVNDAAEA